MIHRVRLSIAAFVVFSGVALPQGAIAKEWPEFHQLKAGESVEIHNDRAYLLFRVSKSSTGWLTPVFLRVPSADEIASYDAAKRIAYAKAGSKAGQYDDFVFQNGKFNNIYGISAGDAIADDGATRTYLVEVQPSNYVLVGVGTRSLMWTCFAQGTVQASARGGVVTDLGTLLFDRADRPATAPELASVTNLGSMARMDYLMFAGAVRPVSVSEASPASLRGVAIVAADYRAAPPFFLASALFSNFLAPLPGVLEYRRGEVYDVKAQAVLSPR